VLWLFYNNTTILEIYAKKGERIKSFALFLSNNQTIVFYNLYAKPSFAVPGIAFGIFEIDGV